jgi:hypothetical protein
MFETPLGVELEVDERSRVVYVTAAWCISDDA